jgi:hypothetical protein
MCALTKVYFFKSVHGADDSLGLYLDDALYRLISAHSFAMAQVASQWHQPHCASCLRLDQALCYCNEQEIFRDAQTRAQQEHSAASLYTPESNEKKKARINGARAVTNIADEGPQRFDPWPVNMRHSEVISLSS